jgi:hypothetical protein
MTTVLDAIKQGRSLDEAKAEIEQQIDEWFHSRSLMYPPSFQHKDCSFSYRSDPKPRAREADFGQDDESRIYL